jgi:hypothetical protein
MTEIFIMKNRVIPVDSNKGETEINGIPESEWEKIDMLPDAESYLKVYEIFPGIKAVELYK